MKRLLADENFPGTIIDALIGDGHDLMSVARARPGMEDRAVLGWARDEGRWLLTFDADFGDLIFLHGCPARSTMCRPGIFAVVGRETIRLRSFRETPPSA